LTEHILPGVRDRGYDEIVCLVDGGRIFGLIFSRLRSDMIRFVVLLLDLSPPVGLQDRLVHRAVIRSA